jgi:PEP-CTERM motif
LLKIDQNRRRIRTQQGTNNIMNKRLLLIIAVFVAAGLTARAQNIVQNPGFETGSLAPWTNTGDTSFSGVVNFNQHSGTYAFESGPTSSDGFLDQTLPTTASGLYNVSFWLRNDDSSGNNRFGASLGSVTLVAEAVQAGFAYTQYSFTNVQPGANADLHFIFYNPPSFFYLDDVSVTAVPEPGTLALIGLGGLGLVAALRKRLV